MHLLKIEVPPDVVEEGILISSTHSLLTFQIHLFVF